MTMNTKNGIAWNGTRPEFEVTKRYMEEYIPGDTPAEDSGYGGGPGRYSIFLAQKGHDVTLFDLSGKNIRQAIEKAQEADVLLDSCIHGDALRLSEYLYKAEQYDVVLLMGPLYHLMREQDREKALQEALRVLKPGGLLFASFISTYAPIQVMPADCTISETWTDSSPVWRTELHNLVIISQTLISVGKKRRKI